MLLALHKAPLDGFDVILMDIQMPEMDVLADTAAMRQYEVEKHTPQLIERTAHALQGSVGNFAFPGAYYTLQKLEDAARKGDLSAMTDIFATVEIQMQALQAALGVFQKEHAV